VLGTVNPIKEIAAIAHEHGALVLVDGAQAVSHKKVDVQALGCDFYAFSAHKLYGPTGVGVLYAKRQHLAQMPPYQGGGSMIASVSFSKITYAKGPQKFEAGTRNIIGVIGLSAAISYVQSIGIAHIADYEDHLLQQVEHKLRLIPGVKIIGNAKSKVSVLSFVCEGMHPHDIGTVLDHEGVAVRVGHHCAMPLMERLQLPATVRVSLGLYNTKEDIDALIAGLWVAKRILG
jgi:cysteine desulfurase/selenocysteine lyase